MKVLLICNDLGFFCNHFMTVARRLCEEGYHVTVLSGGDEDKSVRRIREIGCDFRPLAISRTGINPFEELSVFLRVFQVIRAENPDLVHFFTIKPCLYGGISARILRVRRVVATVTGLGYTFSGSTRLARLRKGLLTVLYKLAFSGRRRSLAVVFENLDDKQFFETAKIIREDQGFRVWGAGVDLKKFFPREASSFKEHGAAVKVLLPSRMLKDKGIVEFIEASNILKKRKLSIEMILVGGIDEHNPSRFTRDEIQSLVDREGIIWRGFRADMPDQLREADIVCLPSYREGMPKVLLEAMACGKAVITTDAPGCREAIEPNVQGFLIPPRDSIALADAIVKLVENPKLRERMGQASRERAERLFGDTMVADEYVSIYLRLIAKSYV